MLLPVRVAHIYERRPVATWTLVGLNVAAFALMEAVGREAMRPLVLDTHRFAPYQLVTALFMHAGFWHLAGNMLFLWVYGRYVEERMGPWRFLLVYFACSLAGAIAFAAVGGGRVIGASGAISGLMGFVLVGAPWAEIELLLVWGMYGAYTRTFSVVALWVVGLWIVFQVLSAAAGWGVLSRVAYSAHIGGCVAGATIAAYLRSHAARGKSWYLDPAPPGGGIAATRRLQRARGKSPRACEADTLDTQVELQSLAGVESRVAILKLLVKHADMDPLTANQVLDSVEHTGPQTVSFSQAEPAARFAQEAHRLGLRLVLDEPPTDTPLELASPRMDPQESAQDDEQEAKAPLRFASGQVIELEPDIDGAE